MIHLYLQVQAAGLTAYKLRRCSLACYARQPASCLPANGLGPHSFEREGLGVGRHKQAGVQGEDGADMEPALQRHRTRTLASTGSPRSRGSVGSLHRARVPRRVGEQPGPADSSGGTWHQRCGYTMVRWPAGQMAS